VDFHELNLAGQKRYAIDVAEKAGLPGLLDV
jgi:hypothetical protein